MEPGLQQSAIAKILPGSMTGADMYSICSNAWLSAVRRTIYGHQNGQSNGNGKSNGIPKILDGHGGEHADAESESQLTAADVIVRMTDFVESSGNFVPSVSAKDMEYFIRLKASFSVN